MMNDRYLGNINIPRAGAKKNWTAEQIKEYQKCMLDPVHFAEKYFKIVHVDHGLIPMILFDYQKEVINAYLTNKEIVMNTSRQAGKTSAATVIILHFALFNKNKDIAILANKGSQAREILSRIQMAYEYLPEFLKGGVKQWNKGSVEFENGSKIVAAASSSTAIRGNSKAMVYIDETAFVPHWDEFSASVLPVLSSGKESRLILTSTPCGLNHFYEYCEGAKNGTNGFWYIEVPWDKVPGRDEAWKQKTLAILKFDQQKFDVEYCCEFVGSSGTLLSGACLKRLAAQNPILMNDKGLKQYEEPVKLLIVDGEVKQGDHQYVLVADVSRGKALDYSAFSVFDVTNLPYKQVCTFHNNVVSPREYAGIIHAVAKAYNSAYVVVENNDLGAQVCDIIHEEFEYENILWTEGGGRGGKRIASGSRTSQELGVKTTKTTKSTGCAVAKLIIESNQLILNDKETISEFNRFSQHGQSYEAEEGAHDDLVMGVVLFAWLTTDIWFKQLVDRNTVGMVFDQDDDSLIEEMPTFRINNGVPTEESKFEKFGGELWEKQNDYGYDVPWDI